MAAHLAGDDFKEALGFGFSREGKAHLLAHLDGEARGDASASIELHVENAREEAVDDAEILGGEAGDGVGGER